MDDGMTKSHNTEGEIKDLKILFVEDEPESQRLLAQIIERAGYRLTCSRVSDEASLLACLEEDDWDLVITDYNIPGFGGEQAVLILAEQRPDLPCIVVSGTVGEEIAVDLLKKGAVDFVSKASPSRLVPAVERELNEVAQRRRRQAMEARYAAVVESIEVGVAVIDLDMRIVTLNRKMKEWFPRIDVGAHPICYEAYNEPPRESPCTYCPTIETLRDGQVHESITATPSHDGIISYRVMSSPIRDEQGKITAVIELVEDISAKVAQEEALKKSEQKYRILYDSSMDAIMTLEPPVWRFTSGNAATLKMFGVADEAAFTALGPWQLSPPVQPDGRASDIKAAEMIELAMKNGSNFFEWQHKRLEGESFPATVLLTRMDIDSHSFLQATVRDLTEQKRIERELAQAQKLESIGQLAAGIAHEINTPTQYIGDHTSFVKDVFDDLLPLLAKHGELLEACKTGEVTDALIKEVEDAIEAADIDYVRTRVPRAIEQALEGVSRVSTIVRAMKDFAHPGPAELAPTNLNQAITSTATVARNEWKYVADLELDLDEDLPEVPCLQGEINQVILNLVVNAAHAIADKLGDATDGQKGQIVVSTRRDGDFAEIRIEDSGTGIEKNHREAVFDPFFTTKEVGKGTGQGLAIAYNVITKKHNGSITFETEVGEGTTFIIRLPLGASGLSHEQVDRSREGQGV